MGAVGTTPRRRVGLNALALALGAAGIGVLTFRLGTNSVTVPPHSVVFKGTITSVYATGQGGCVAAISGQGLSRAKDAYCGPFYRGEGVSSVTVGLAVTATQFTTTAADGEDISGFLLARR